MKDGLNQITQKHAGTERNLKSTSAEKYVATNEANRNIKEENSKNNQERQQEARASGTSSAIAANY